MTDQDNTVEMSTVETPVGNPDNAAEGTGAVADPPNGTTPAGEKLSAYKQRLQELGREGVGAEIPLELADMMRAAAKARGDIALSAWIRLAFAEAVNAAGLTHVVTAADGTSTSVDWKFDTKVLEETKARTSTRNLSPEEKKEKAEKAKAEAVDQRALVRRLLAEHRSKVLGGNA